MEECSPSAKRQCTKVSGESQVRAVMNWLRSQGAVGFEKLRITDSTESGGGLGVFATEKVGPNGVVVRIPQECVVTVAAAWASEVGRQCADIPNATDEFVMALWLAIGRIQPEHPYHVYLTSLPSDPPNVPCWDEESMAPLEGTNLGVAAKEKRELLDSQCAAILPSLGERGMLGSGSQLCDVSSVRWGRSMYSSRCFPATLKHGNEEAAESTRYEDHVPGVLVPGLDFLNHRQGKQLKWESNSESVLWTASSEGVACEAELFYNYGNKGNEELMMSYGFALDDNQYDTYPLKLVVCEGEQKRALGPFHIKREETEDEAGQFPPELWVALAGGEPGASVDGALEIGAEEVEMLASTLTQRLIPFAETAARDIEMAQVTDDKGDKALRRVFAAIYRCGQRIVLEQAVGTLQEVPHR